MQSAENQHTLLLTWTTLHPIQNSSILLSALSAPPSKTCDRIRNLANCIADHDYEAYLISVLHTKCSPAHNAIPVRSFLTWWANTGAQVRSTVRMPLLCNIQNSQSTMQSWNRSNKSCFKITETGYGRITKTYTLAKKQWHYSVKLLYHIFPLIGWLCFCSSGIEIICNE